jgi:ABC-2 type transport system permease protein
MASSPAPASSLAGAEILASVNPKSTSQQIGILARYQLRNYLRSFRFLILVGIVAAIGALLTVLVAHYRPGSLLSSSVNFYSGIWVGGISIVIILSTVIFGGDAIAGEFQNKTGYFLMGLPIRRVSVYLGKYIAALLASLSIMAFYAAILIVNAVYYFGLSAFPWQFGASFVLACIYMLAVLGFTFLLSSLFKTSAYALVLTAILFLFGFTLLQDVYVGLVNAEPWFIISYAQGVVGAIFTNPYPARVVQTRSMFPPHAVMTVYTPTIVEGVGIMILYVLVTTLAGLFLFQREEFT